MAKESVKNVKFVQFEMIFKISDLKNEIARITLTWEKRISTIWIWINLNQT